MHVPVAEVRTQALPPVIAAAADRRPVVEAPPLGVYFPN